MYQSDFLAELKDKYEVSRKERDLRISAERVRRDHAGELSRRMEDNIEKRLREHLQITEVAVVEVIVALFCPSLWDYGWGLENTVAKVLETKF